MKRILIFMKPHYLIKMAAPIPQIVKYSIVYNLLNFQPIFIKFMPKFIVCKVLYFKAQNLLRLHSPLLVDVLCKYTDKQTNRNLHA